MLSDSAFEFVCEVDWHTTDPVFGPCYEGDAEAARLIKAAREATLALQLYLDTPPPGRAGITSGKNDGA